MSVHLSRIRNSVAFECWYCSYQVWNSQLDASGEVRYVNYLPLPLLSALHPVYSAGGFGCLYHHWWNTVLSIMYIYIKSFYRSDTWADDIALYNDLYCFKAISTLWHLETREQSNFQRKWKINPARVNHLERVFKVHLQWLNQCFI